MPHSTPRKDVTGIRASTRAHSRITNSQLSSARKNRSGLLRCQPLLPLPLRRKILRKRAPMPKSLTPIWLTRTSLTPRRERGNARMRTLLPVCLHVVFVALRRLFFCRFARADLYFLCLTRSPTPPPTSTPVLIVNGVLTNSTPTHTQPLTSSLPPPLR